MEKNNALIIWGWFYGLSAGNTSPVTGSVPAASAWRISRWRLLSCIGFTSFGIAYNCVAYKVIGNITSLDRDGTGAKVYNYYNSSSSNWLKSVSGLTGRDYEYDGNGNVTKDGLNSFDLTYNHLNLPATAIRATGTPVDLSYTYDASGNKLAKISNGSVRNYVDGIEYRPDGTIDIIHTEEGIAQNNGGTYTYHYNLNDHLGNVRLTFDVLNGLISPLQKDDYYAFGKRKTSMQGSVDNKYLYNGKELQDELGQYDYGARFYDPVIGRWNVVDPLSEVSRRNSPYNYALNNPIRFIDVDGMYADDGPGPKPKPKFEILPPIENPDGDQQGYFRNAPADQKNYDPFGAFMLNLSAGAADVIGLNALDNLFFSNEKVTWAKAGLAALAVVQGMEAIEGASPSRSSSVKTGQSIPNEASVVRGGTNTPELIAKGTGTHPEGPTGVSELWNLSGKGVISRIAAK